MHAGDPSRHRCGEGVRPVGVSLRRACAGGRREPEAMGDAVHGDAVADTRYDRRTDPDLGGIDLHEMLAVHVRRANPAPELDAVDADDQLPVARAARLPEDLPAPRHPPPPLPPPPPPP